MNLNLLLTGRLHKKVYYLHTICVKAKWILLVFEKNIGDYDFIVRVSQSQRGKRGKRG